MSGKGHIFLSLGSKNDYIYLDDLSPLLYYQGTKSQNKKSQFLGKMFNTVTHFIRQNGRLLEYKSLLCVRYTSQVS